MGSLIFFRTSLVPSITYILVMKIGWAVFKKIRFFDFSRFVHNFCKKKFFNLILGVNLSCNGSHLPSQYGSHPSGGTQTIGLCRSILFTVKCLTFSWCSLKAFSILIKLVELYKFLQFYFENNNNFNQYF